MRGSRDASVTAAETRGNALVLDVENVDALKRLPIKRGIAWAFILMPFSSNKLMWYGRN